jgi:putative transposase
MLVRGVPEHIRSDNRAEMTAKVVRNWADAGWRKDPVHRTRQPLRERLLRILQRKLRDELLNGVIFYSLKEAQIVIEQWRKHYNTIRPHSSLSYRRRRRRR